MKLYQLEQFKPSSVFKNDNELVIQFNFGGLVIQKITTLELYTNNPQSKRINEIRIDMNSKTIVNIKEEFEFHSGLRNKRIPLVTLQTCCLDFMEEIEKIIARYQTSELLTTLEQQNIQREIDRHLELGDFETCRKLVELCKQTSMVYQ